MATCTEERGRSPVFHLDTPSRPKTSITYPHLWVFLPTSHLIQLSPFNIQVASWFPIIFAFAIVCTVHILQLGLLALGPSLMCLHLGRRAHLSPSTKRLLLILYRVRISSHLSASFIPYPSSHIQDIT